MEQLIIVLLVMNILITLTAATTIKNLIKIKSEEINNETVKRIEILGYDIALVDKKISKERIREAVKGEISDEIRKLAFTPIKLNK